MTTNFWHFKTFKGFVNAKLDANKYEKIYEKILPEKKESKCLRNENKNQQAIIEMLIRTAIKTR